jgi:hypothetical protein
MTLCPANSFCMFSVGVLQILTYKNNVFCAQFIIASKLFTRASLEIHKLCFYESRLSTMQTSTTISISKCGFTQFFVRLFP